MTKTKICTKCKIEKPFAAFCNTTKGKYGRESCCKKCKNDYAKKYRQIHKPKMIKYMRKYCRTENGKFNQRKNHLKRTFGLTLKQYDQMSERQNGVCAICGNINKSGRRLYVDHNHKTGKIRGLLCHKCNTYLSALEDKKFADSAKKYLLKY